MKRLRYPIVGLTGNIGSGKSTAARRLQSLGARVLDADKVSRALLERDGACFDETVRMFGARILDANGNIDRKALGGIVFSDEGKRRQLNGIIHPHVIDGMLKQAKQLLTEDPTMPVVLDVPLLFESGMDRSVDYVVLVYCDDAVRLQRILLRDGCTEADAVARMRAQRSQEEKRLLADAVIDNSSDLEALHAQVDALYGVLTEMLP